MNTYKFLVTSDDPIILPDPTGSHGGSIGDCIVIEGVVALVVAADVPQARMVLKAHWAGMYGDAEAEWVEFCEPTVVDLGTPGVIGLARV